MGTHLPLPKRGLSPQFSVHVYCGQTAGWTKMALGMQMGLGPGHIVLDRDPALPSPKRGRTRQFSVHVYCGQTAGWIKMPVGTEVGLGPGDIVLHANRLPPQKKWHSPSIFGPCLLWPNGCMYQDTTWYGGRPQPRRHCVRWGTAFPIFGQCGQAPWWTKMPLGMEVGLGPGDCIRWGPSSPGKKGLRPTQF